MPEESRLKPAAFQPSQYDLVYNLAAVAGMLFLLLPLVLSWGGLPKTIPTHFGPSGKADDWGGRSILFVMPIFAVLAYFGIGFLRRFPHVFNYPYAITEANAERQYALARALLNLLRLEMVWLFAYIEWIMIRTAQGKAVGLGGWFLPVSLVVIFGTLAGFIIRMVKAK